MTKIPEVTKERVISLARDGQYSKAVSALAPSTVLAPTPDVLDSLRKLHPAADAPAIPPLPHVEIADPTRRELRKLLRSFPIGSSGGISRLTPRVLTQVYMHSWENISWLVGCFARGDVPEFARPWFFGARLIPLAKKAGGVRPIASGDVFRRLGAKLLAAKVKKDMATLLLDHGQVGVGVPGGAEIATHLARRVGDLWQQPDFADHVIVKIDVKNAFNTVDRSAMLEAACRHCPAICGYAFAAYSSPSTLAVAGGGFVESASGVQQGDPLGPLLFSLALLDATIKAKAEHKKAGTEPPKLDMAYLDDMVMGGQVLSVACYFELLRTHCAAVGLEFNPGKCEVISASGSVTLADIPLANCHPLTAWDLLGVPLGSEAHCSSQIARALAKGKAKLEGITQLDDAHVEFTLLRHCCSFGLGVFYARACGPVAMDALCDFDKSVRATFENTIAPLTERQWLQATLPCRLGGLGLRELSKHAAAAFVVAATCAGTGAPSLFSDELPPDALPQEALLDPRLLSVPSAAQACAAYVETKSGRGFGDKAQKKISALIDEHQLDELVKSAERLELVRLRSCSRPFASSWVAPINAAIGTPLTLMESADFVIAISLRLGLTIAETPATCVCGAPVDPLGHHALCCTRANRHPVHNALRLAIVNLSSKALCRPLPEARPFSLPHSGLRVDVLLRDNVGDRPVALDVTVVTPFSATRSNIDLAEGDTYAVRLASKTKHTKYDAACGDLVRFVPLAVDALGAWSDVAVALFKRLARLAGRRDDLHASQAIPLELQRLALVLQVGIARLVRLSLAASSVPADNNCTNLSDPDFKIAHPATADPDFKIERSATTEINNKDQQPSPQKKQTAPPAHLPQQQQKTPEQSPIENNNNKHAFFACEPSAADASAAVVDVAVESRSASVCSALSCSVESCCSTSSHVPPSVLKAEGAG
jgi:hypothetical protein